MTLTTQAVLIDVEVGVMLGDDSFKLFAWFNQHCYG
jgi:hypothetical protein